MTREPGTGREMVDTENEVLIGGMRYDKWKWLR